MSDWGIIGDDPRILMEGRMVRAVAFDAETTGLNYYDNVLGLSFAWRNGVRIHSCYVYQPLGQMSMDDGLERTGSISIQDLMRETFQRHEMVAHYEAFDARAAHRVSPTIRPKHSTHDPMHLASLLSFQQGGLSLEALYPKYIGTPLPDSYRAMKKNRSRLKDIPLGPVAEYGRQDAVNALELFEVLHPQVIKMYGEDFYSRDRRYAAYTMDMIRKGIPFNYRWAQKRARDISARLRELQTVLSGYGLMNTGSNDSEATFLFKTLGLNRGRTTNVKTTRWKDGIPSVDSEVLESLKDYHPAVGALLEYRQLQGAISKWLTPFQSDAQIDGRIHATINPFGTISSRITATDPNVAAIPMEDRGAAFGSMKGMFSAERSELWAFDYSQAEARVAAVFSREQPLIQMFKSGRDPYELMAMRMWGDVGMRDRAKRGFLAMIYEVGVEKFSRTHGLTYEESDNILTGMRMAFRGMKLASRLSQAAARRGYVEVYTGRRRWFGPDDEDYKAFNQRVQTTVAEIIRDAILAVGETVPEVLVLQIYDSLIAELPISGRKGSANTRKEMRREIEECMQRAVPDDISSMLDIPTKVKRWDRDK